MNINLVQKNPLIKKRVKKIISLTLSFILIMIVEQLFENPINCV